MVPDPDTELWPQVAVNIWPFVGAPTRGAFRTGWMGIDAAATVWVCTAGGAPGTWAQVGSGGGGGGNDVPIANPTGITTGTETPDPISGSDTAKWVEFPADATVMAWGLAGDAFPRVVFGADPGDFGLVMLGNGTFDPTSNGAAVFTKTSDIATRGLVPHITGQSVLQGPVLGSGALSVTPTPPHGIIGGELDDIAITPTGIWVCTTAGDAAAAVWTLMATPFS